MCYGKVPRYPPWQREGIPMDVSTSKSQELPCPTQHTLGKLHTREHHAQYINWRSWYAVRNQLLLRDRLRISQRVVSNCFVHHFPFLGFILPVFLCPFSLLLISVIFHIISVISPYLSPWVLHFFQFSFPSHFVGRGSEEYLCGTYILAVIKPWQKSPCLLCPGTQPENARAQELLLSCGSAFVCLSSTDTLGLH